MTSEHLFHEKNLQYLDTDWKLATVYTAFLSPKSHQDAVRLIYGLQYDREKRAPVIHHPQQWIKDARDQLMERDLIKITEQKLKGSIIKANIDPILHSLIQTGTVKMNDLSILEGLRIVLDSQWFRNIFTFENIHYPMTYKDGTVYEPFRNLVRINKEDNTRKLEVRNLQNRIFQLLFEIGYYSHNFRYLANESVQQNGLTSGDNIIDDLLLMQNFDRFLQKHYPEVPSYFIETMISCMKNTGIDSMDQTYSERLIFKILREYAGIFMPMELSIALRSSACYRTVQPVDCGYVRKVYACNYRQAMEMAEKRGGTHEK